MRHSGLALTGEQAALIADAGRRAHPREACGLLAGGHVVVLQNVLASPEGRRAFDTDPAEVRAAVEAAGGWSAVDAVWHSHPRHDGDAASGQGSPSATDVAAHPVGPVLIVVDGDGVAHGWEHTAPERFTP